MKNKAVFEIILVLLTISISMLAGSIRLVEADPKIILVPEEYSSIQEAINSASEGDVVFIKSGIYHEHFVVNKMISLIGENKYTTIISGSGLQRWYGTSPPWWGLVTILSANNVTINGFTIQDWDTGPGYGIGMAIRLSNYCNISDNLFINLDTPMILESSRNNLFSGNLLLNDGGISFEEGSSFNTFESNTFINSSLGVGSCPGFQNIDTSNTIDGKPIYYLVNQRDKQVPSNAGYIAVVNSTRITVKDVSIDYTLTFTGTSNSIIQNVNITQGFLGFGFYLLSSHNNTIQDSTLRGTGEAIRLERSDHNSIVRNTISYNSNDGVAFYSSNENIVVENTISIDWKYSNSFLIAGGSSNMIYSNNIIDHYDRGIFLPQSRFNFWDNGVKGNFWSNYHGIDNDEDGIGDSPYVIDSINQDNHPLMNPWPGCPDTLRPTADAGEDKNAPQNVTVEFDGNDSYDNVGIVSYEWNFGDGANATGKNASHMYSQPWLWETITKFTVTLTVRDAEGNSDSTSIIVSILRDSNEDGIPDISDSDNDGIPDVWETRHGLNPYNSADATEDPDGDLLSNIEEYHLGTDPHVFNISWKNMVLFLALTLIAAITASILLLHKQRTISIKERESGKTL